jgi:hypothetical protein
MKKRPTNGDRARVMMDSSEGLEMTRDAATLSNRDLGANLNHAAGRNLKIIGRIVCRP